MFFDKRYNIKKANVFLLVALIGMLLCSCIVDPEISESDNDYGVTVSDISSNTERDEVERLDSNSDSNVETNTKINIAYSGGNNKVPTDYYNAVDGLTGEALKAVLNDIITEDHVPLTYDQVYSALEDTDEDPDDASKVVLFYKGVSVADNELRMSDDGDIWNREHIWAKSHGDFGTNRGPGTDLHMIRPTDASVNARRGHLDFDESDNAFDEAYGTYVDKDSFEPRDEVKGDVARMLFYMAVRYEGEEGEVDLELSNRTDTYYLTDNKYGEHGKLDTLLAWHEEDPVDVFEMTRNDVVYEIQGNRNPFIDYPEWVACIWTSGEKPVNGELENELFDAMVLDIAEARKMSDDSFVAVEGIVTYGEKDTTIYIQDITGGIRIDSYGSDVKLSAHQVGNRVLIEGVIDTYKGEKEIRITHEDDIKIVGYDEAYDYKKVKLSEILSGNYQGQLVQIEEALVVQVNKHTFTVEDDSGNQMVIYYGNIDHMNEGDINTGENYTLMGIASWYDGVQVKLIEKIKEY